MSYCDELCKQDAQVANAAQEQRQGDGNVDRSTCAIIVAGGLGQRFGNPAGKQYVALAGMPILCWSVLAADRAASVCSLVVVTPKGYIAQTQHLIEDTLTLIHPICYVEGGTTRQESVAHGLSRVPTHCGLIAVHDGARPLAQSEAFEACIDRLQQDALLVGAIAATPSIDTLKLVEGTTVISTPDRSFYWCAQTPQIFHREVLLEAYRLAAQEGFIGTDDASLVERQGGRVACVDCGKNNLKVTLPEDALLAEALLEQRLSQEGCGF